MILKSKVKIWKRRLALFPIILNDGPDRTWIWLEWVWLRDAGLYREISLTDPTQGVKVIGTIIGNL